MDDTGRPTTAPPGADPHDPTGRLGAYVARTQSALDLLALVTLWVVVVPIVDIGGQRDLRIFGLTIRLVLSAIYALDMAIRTVLAADHWRYLRTHPLGVLAALVPPVRVLFSFRLVSEVFRRGNLVRYLVAALILLLNGAIIVYLYEREAPGANITTLGASLWWSVVTVATVGYGDYYPITVQGQVTATLIMLVGIITVAVITAQVASSFVDQRARSRLATRADDDDVDDVDDVAALRSPAASADPTGAVTIDDLDARLARIEQLLVDLRPPGG